MKTYQEMNTTINKLYTFEKDSKEYTKYFNYCLEYFDYICKQQASPYFKFNNYEDLLQEARIALYCAIKSYNPQKSKDKDGKEYFAQWAILYIKTRLKRKANKYPLVNMSISKFQKLRKEEFAGIKSVNIEDFTKEFDFTSQQTFKENQDIQDLHESISKLPEECKPLIKYKLDGFNDKEIMAKLNINKREFKVIYEKAIKAMRTSMA